MFVDNYIKQYIRDKWHNYRKSLNEPQAREEILSGAKLYFYEKNTRTPKYVFYKDSSIKDLPFPHPVIAAPDGYFPEMYLEVGQEDQYEVELRTRDNVSLIQCSTHKGFEV